MKNLKLVILPGRDPAPEVADYYELAYKHWSTIWGQTFKELDGTTVHFSDEFSRQDEIITLFDGLLCVAMLCHRVCDFNSRVSAEDSYFRSWTPKAIDGLIRHGRRILVGSQISVDPSRRGRENGIGLKNLICYLAFHQWNTLQVDGVTGTMRLDRNMSTVMQEAGAEVLEKNVLFHNVPVDLVAFHPCVRPVRIPAFVEELVTSLWLESLGRSPLENLKKKFHPEKRRVA